MVPNLKRDLLAIAKALRRATAMQRRAEAVQARADTRDWAKARRARTRELIELGGLVTKSGLLELVAAVPPAHPPGPHARRDGASAAGRHSAPTRSATR